LYETKEKIENLLDQASEDHKVMRLVLKEANSRGLINYNNEFSAKVRPRSIFDTDDILNIRVPNSGASRQISHFQSVQAKDRSSQPRLESLVYTDLNKSKVSTDVTQKKVNRYS